MNKDYLIRLTLRLCTGFALIWPLTAAAQSSEVNNQIRSLIQQFKQDDRGPYQAIRWFCPDGTIIPANQRCTERGGIQHALHKDVVQRLASTNGIYLGQILAGTKVEHFLDAANNNSRLKQYQLERYLALADDGWIFRKARFYRGAIQAEDEEAWGLSFLTWLAGQEQIITQQYFLLRQASKDIPHNARDDRMTEIRVLAKTVADSLPSFMNLRIKIHGQPDAGDVQRVRNFYAAHRSRISPGLAATLQKLLADMEETYQPFDFRALQQYIDLLPEQSPVRKQVRKIVEAYIDVNLARVDSRLARKLAADIAELLWLIRQNLIATGPAPVRLAAIDLSILMEGLTYRTIANWRPETTAELMGKAYILAKTAAAIGYLSIWEWEEIDPILQSPLNHDELPFEVFFEKVEFCRRAVEWGTGMIRAVYGPTIGLFNGFEPLAFGYTDELVRSSVLLALGETAGELQEVAGRFSGVAGNIMGLKNQRNIHGLNPGVALGELIVVKSHPEEIVFSSKKIYVLEHAPADIKPIAGIATVNEGNLVSHVQLLARNLGIPNAVLSAQSLDALLPFAGQQVFYAVSPGGAVIMKPAAQMTEEEKALVLEKARPEEKIRVPVEKTDLSQAIAIDLRSLRAADSGRICGPKAANLGQLKNLFPGKVVEGLVIPFGVFRRHMAQRMPQSGMTYWQSLQETFRGKSSEGADDETAEKYILERLAQLREAIKNMPLMPEFEQDWRDRFALTFGAAMGKVPVFIRSDTNMEDLKDFTGAGLNLTVFNVVDADKILQAIRDVWASPYSERSYSWRQKYLTNPESVYPSILVLPTVNVDKSGVLITTGISSSDPKDVTVAFNRGVGGAVEGQAAETFLLQSSGRDLLIRPARDESYTSVPATGGTQKQYTHLHEPILTWQDREKLRLFADEINTKLSAGQGIASAGPFDVELGFKNGKIVLFQVRPFVENKRARSSIYLRKLDPVLPRGKKILLNQSLSYAR